MKHYGEEVKNKGFFDKLEDLNDRFDDWWEWDVKYAFQSKANFYNLLAATFKSPRLDFLTRLLADIENDDFIEQFYTDNNDPFRDNYWLAEHQAAYAACEVEEAKANRTRHVALYNKYKFWWMRRK